MYTVTVIRQSTGEAIDERRFAYGNWQEIGYWLDQYGYNDPAFRLNVSFS